MPARRSALWRRGDGGGVAVIDIVLPLLRCPVCAGPLTRTGASVGCPAGHTFDLGRGGYLNLRTGRARRIVGDTAPMVAARESFLGDGNYAPLTARLAQVAATVLDRNWVGGSPQPGPRPGQAVLEIGVGTGHHLAGVVASRPKEIGLAVDVSRPALRRAARAHPRIGAVAFDVAAPWPVAEASIAVLLDVFAPRNLPEMRRVLRPGGLLVVVTPGPGHLAELRGPLGLVGMEAGKSGRLDDQAAGLFDLAGVEELVISLALTRDEIVDLATMGPTGHHVGPDELRRRAAVFFGVTGVTACFQLRRYHPLPVELR